MKHVFFSRVLTLALCVAALCALAGRAEAAMRVNIYGPAENVVKLALAAPLGPNAQPATGLGAELARAIREDLSFLPFVRLTDPRAILNGDKLNGYQPPNIDFKRFQLAGADMLITAGWPKGDKEGSTVELRLYETSSGQFVFGNSYSGVVRKEINEVADRFCADLMKALTGHGDFFLSTLAFVKTGSGKYKRDVWTVKPTGRNLRKITDIPGQAMSPSWSMDGRFVVFGHLDDRSHALGVWDRLTNRVQRIRFPGNTVIGPVFMPDNKVAVSLSTGKYPDIYLLNHAFQKERALEESPAINVSPTFDATGTKMAFTSSRMGSPQIFVKDLKTGTITRVSRQGSYNTEPQPGRHACRLFPADRQRASHLCAGHAHGRGAAGDLRAGERRTAGLCSGQLFSGLHFQPQRFQADLSDHPARGGRQKGAHRLRRRLLPALGGHSEMIFPYHCQASLDKARRAD